MGCFKSVLFLLRSSSVYFPVNKCIAIVLGLSVSPALPPLPAHYRAVCVINRAARPRQLAVSPQSYCGPHQRRAGWGGE